MSALTRKVGEELRASLARKPSVYYSMSFISYLHKAVNRENLSSAEAQMVMELVLSGEVTTAQIAGIPGRSADERRDCGRIGRLRARDAGQSHEGEDGNHGRAVLDTCGTGGDGSCTFNVSTVAAFVVAGAGVKVAKHGNRSISSQCGSADILEALGVHIAPHTGADRRSRSARSASDSCSLPRCIPQ